jgi:hypothetical protein
MMMVGWLTFAVTAAQAAPAAPAPIEPTGSDKERAQPEIREIEKGTYAQANVGAAMYLDKFAGAVSPGTSLGLSIGHDFVDQEKTSMAFEFAFFQGIHNGINYQEQGNGPYVEGDLRTYSLVALLEWSFYPSRRVGLGLRAGGGMMTSPMLMDDTYYKRDVLTDTWGLSNDPGYHGVWHVVGLGGPCIEYYTKLNHFSVGLDADVFYASDFDLGLNVTAALKYTF